MSAEEFSIPLPPREARPGFFARATMFNVLLLLVMIVPFSVLAFRPPAAEEEAQRERLRDLEGRRATRMPLKFKDGLATLGPVKLGQTPPLF